MLDFLRRIWARANTHWNRGGGHIAARLWWLAFVLNVLTVLATAPTFRDQGHALGDAPLTASLSNLKQVGVALQMYVQDYDEHLPPMTNTIATRQALAKYLARDDLKLLVALWQNPKLNVPYAVNTSLSLHSVEAYPNPGQTVAVWDTRVWNGEVRDVCFLDGHVKAVSLAEWERLRTLSGIVKDAPTPSEPPWWRTLTRDSLALIAWCFLPFGACLTAFFAAWREA